MFLRSLLVSILLAAMAFLTPPNMSTTSAATPMVKTSVDVAVVLAPGTYTAIRLSAYGVRLGAYRHYTPAVRVRSSSRVTIAGINYYLMSSGIWAGYWMPVVSGVSIVAPYHVPVLMYHRIAPASEIGGDLAYLCVSPAQFDSQLAAMKANGWRTVTSAQLAAAMAAKRDLPPKTFVISFDDGRVDGYTYAYPILRKYGFTATYFIIGSRRSGNYISWEQMRTMQAAGMEIGNHTYSHVDLTKATRAQTDYAVNETQRLITVNTGVTPVSFAYPFGQHPDNLMASVKAAGLKVAYTVVNGASEGLGNAFLLPRIAVNNPTTAAQLMSRVNPYR